MRAKRLGFIGSLQEMAQIGKEERGNQCQYQRVDRPDRARLAQAQAIVVVE